jgi:hypothetical protein
MVEPASALEAEPLPRAQALRDAVINTLVYADLFDYPLTPSEIQRYLVGEAASMTEVTAILDGDADLLPHIEQTHGWVHLTGRRQLATIRRERAAASAQLWPIARRYGVMVARLPFVQLVGVTGALAMNNAATGDDIDLFIVVQPGRLWLCRLLVLAVVKLAARRGTELCPNFLISADHLRLSERNLYTAHEVAQLVPLAPSPCYPTFLNANRWISNFLPNALPARSMAEAALDPRPARGIVSSVLSTHLFDPIERWEMKRKMRRLEARYEREGGSVAFSAHECRGHFAAHDTRILAAYRRRLAAYAESLS